MAELKDKDVLAIIELREKLGAACEGFTIGQVVHALTVLTTDVFLQAGEKTPVFIANVTEFTCDNVKLHAAQSALKDNGYSTKVH